MGLETIAIAALVVGAGVSAYGQYQAGQTQNAIAQYNARQQQLNARAQLDAMQTQAAIMKSTAETNFKLQQAAAQARFGNARALEKRALAQDVVSRENLRKRREDFSRMQGEQRAALAASGVAESAGTPLDLLAETAAKIQLDQEEQHYANEAQRRTLFREADMERFGGKLALAGATLDRNSAVAEAGLRDAAARAGYLGDMRAAEITRLTGSAARTAATYQAGATLLSGLSGAANYYARS